MTLAHSISNITITWTCNIDMFLCGTLDNIFKCTLMVCLLARGGGTKIILFMVYILHSDSSGIIFSLCYLWGFLFVVYSVYLVFVLTFQMISLTCFSHLFMFITHPSPSLNIKWLLCCYSNEVFLEIMCFHLSTGIDLVL